MAITGFTPDSTSNGVSFVTTAQTGLSGATIIDETLVISGSGRVDGTVTIDHSQVSLFNNPSSNGPGSNSPLGNSAGILARLQSSFIADTAGITFPDYLRVYFSEFSDSFFIEESDRNVTVVYLQNGGSIENSTFRGIYSIETRATPTISGVTIIDSLLGITTWDSGRLDFAGLSIPSTTSGYLSVLAEGAVNSIYLWNPVDFDFTKILFTTNLGRGYWGYTATWDFKDANGNVQNALIIYRDDRGSIGGSKSEIGRYITNSSGILTGTVDSKTGGTGSDIARPSLWIRTRQTSPTGSSVAQDPESYFSSETIGGVFVEYPYTVQDVSVEIEIRSYLHLAPELIAAPTNEIGKINADESVNFYLPFILSIDEGVTETNTTTVGAYSGITNATSTITLSGTLTLSQFYDSRKLYWRLNDGVAVPTKSGSIADFGTAAITINAPANLPATTAKYSHFTTTGIVTLGAPGDYSGGAAGSIPATGEVQVSDGTINLGGWSFASGAEINLALGETAATVQVDASQLANITAGVGVTLASTPVEFTGFPTGNNTNGVAYAAVIAILNTDDDTLFAAYTGGATYSKSLSEIGNGVGPFEVWGDGVGLRRTIAQAITATEVGPVSLAGLFEEYRSEDGTVLIGLATADVGVIYDQPNTNFEFDGPTHQFLGIIHEFDLLSSTPAGQAFDNTAVRGIQFIFNDAYRRIFLPAPFTISASSTAVGIPVITDCLILRSGTLADVRVDPIVQFAFQAEGGGGGGDATAANQTTIINALAVVDGIVEAILVDTAEIGAAGAGLTEAGGTGDHLTAIPTIANVTTVDTVTNPVSLTTPPLDATATQAAAAAALTAYDPPTRAELSSDRDAILTEGANWVTATGFATPANITDAQTAIITQGNSAWVTANISSLLTSSAYTASLPDNFGALAITEGGLVTSTNPGGGASAAEVWEYTGGDRSLSGAQATAIASADLAARALADGRYVIDYAASTATQYNPDGSVRTVFNLVQDDGTTPATTAATAVERVPE